MTGVARDRRTGIEVIDRDGCLRLLAAGGVGRVAVIAGSEPVIFPVNYVLVDDRIAFRSAPGSKLQAIDWGSKVSFEVDDIDPVAKAGWSVVAVGRAEQVVDARRRAEIVEATGLEPWAEGDHEHLVLVHPDRLSGRRIGGAG